MLLSKLLKQVDTLCEYDDIDITDVCCDSRVITKGAAFVCINGEHSNGSDYAKQALQSGAVVVITEHTSSLKPQVLVGDCRATYALMCKALYDTSDELTLIATTGTNGKTSVTTIISSILDTALMKSGVITTIGARYRDFVEVLDNTTPEPHKLHELLSTMKDDGCEVVCMEASSHALCQKRLDGLRFKVAIFMNLTQDHLNFHADMEDYFAAKCKLFDIADYAVICIDDEYGKRLADTIKIPYATVSTQTDEATFFAEKMQYNNDGTDFLLHHNNIKSKIHITIPGLYSVKNALAAVAAAVHMGVSIKTIKTALDNFVGISGRNEVIKTNMGFSIICDYAHTPDGLQNIIQSTREYAKGRIITVFGCGGDRDRNKREIMGKIATTYSDFTVITSDNPRTENPKRIMSDILKGVAYGANFIPILSRTKAIRYAVSIARKSDIIILAGKGHELYQIIGTQKLHYDERHVVQEALQMLCDDSL